MICEVAFKAGRASFELSGNQGNPMSEPAAYLIISSTPDPSKLKKLQTYIDKAMPILEAHGDLRAEVFQRLDLMLAEAF